MSTAELIARRPSGRAGLAKWYSDAFREQEAEGLGLVDLATLLGVSVANLYHWRRRLRATASPTPASMRHGLIEVTSDPRGGALESRVESSPHLVVKLGSRCIEVRPGFDPTCLGKLVAVLESC